MRVQFALNGAVFGAPGTADLAVRGDRQSRWGFWATNQAAGAAGVSHPIPSPQPGTDSNNFANLFALLPDAATSVAVRVWAANDDAGEVWCVDDIALTGYAGTNDADGDGIDDAWEIANFGSTGVAGAGTDFDHDGLSDLAEFLSGTQPTNSASALRATSVSNAAGIGWVVWWSSASDRVYRLSRSTDLLAGFSGIASNLPATPPLNTYTDAPGTNVMRVYRVELQ